MKRAFTLVELLVVIAILAILMASLGASIAQAQLRSKITKARAQADGITQAIRSYADYVDTGLQPMDGVEADESSLSFILGHGVDRNGQPIRILYNASIVGGKIRDPWGNPYLVTIKSVSAAGEGDQMATGLEEGVFIPNRYGRRAAESAAGGGQ